MPFLFFKFRFSANVTVPEVFVKYHSAQNIKRKGKVGGFWIHPYRNSRPQGENDPENQYLQSSTLFTDGFEIAH